MPKAKRLNKNEMPKEDLKPSEPKTEETKKELTKTLSTSNGITQADQDLEPEEIAPEQDEKLLELERKAFIIDSKGWKEESRRYSPSSDHRIDMKVNPEQDVFEYGGCQSFLAYEALIREISKAKGGIPKEEIEKRYLPTEEQLISILGNPKNPFDNSPRPSLKYSNFYNYNCKYNIRGAWSPGCGHFPMQEGSVGYYLWLAGGKYAYLGDNGWSVRNSCGFPVRLVGASALLFKDE